MKLIALVFFAVIVFVPLVSSQGVGEGNFTRHSEVGNFMEVSLGDQLNVYTNDYMEYELFFDSRNLQGFVEVFSGVGGEPLLGEVNFSELQLGKDNRREVYGQIKNGLDGKPIITARVERNKIILNYNSLSEECGGNYVLSFMASNPSVKVDEKIPVKLRFHIPCESALLMILSPKMGVPSGEFLAVLKSYMKVAGDEGKTVKVTTLPQNVFTVNDTASVPIDKEVTLTYKDNQAPLLHTLRASMRYVISQNNGELVYSDLLGINDGTYTTLAVRKSKDLETYDSFGWPNNILPEGLNFSAVEKQKEFIDLAWFNLSLIVNGAHANGGRRSVFFFPEICDKGLPFRGIEIIEDSRWFKTKTGIHASCERLTDITRDLLTSRNKETEITERDISVTIKLVSHGKLNAVKQVTARITGVTTSPEFLELHHDAVIANNIKNRISRLRNAHEPKYLLLVGSVEHIPMPFLDDVTKRGNEYKYDISGDGIIPSDSLYVFNREANRIEIPAARIPIALDENNPWEFASLVLQNAVKARTKRGQEISLLSDACGAERACFIKHNTDRLVEQLKDADMSFTLRLSPPVCHNLAICNELSQAINDFNNADYLQINTHGDGIGFSSEGISGNTYETLLASDIARHVNNPGLQVSLLACYGGSIDKTNKNFPISRTNSPVFAFLQAGTPLLLGNTRSELGGSGINFAMLFSLINKDKRTAGEIENAYMNQLFQGRSDVFWKDGVSRQLYGDPLLPFYHPA